MTDNPDIDAAKAEARIFLSNIKELADPERGRLAYAVTAVLDCGNMAASNDPRHGEVVIEAAEQGDPIARQAVHQAIMVFVSGGDPLPQRLRDYLAEILLVHDYGPKRRPGHGYYMRDEMIRMAIKAVCARGFKRTRNVATREKTIGAAEMRSACSIVSEVLEELGVDLKEKSIEDIWRARPG